MSEGTWQIPYFSLLTAIAYLIQPLAFFAE